MVKYIIGRSSKIGILVLIVLLMASIGFSVSLFGHEARHTAKEVEPNEDFSNATLIQPHDETSGTFSSSHDVDFYKFHLDKSVSVGLRYLNLPAGTRIVLYDDKRQPITDSVNYKPLVYRTGIYDLDSGDYYLRFEDLSFKSESNPYSVVLVINPSLPSNLDQ